MTEPEDLSGRHFRWALTHENPNAYALFEDPIQVGGIAQATPGLPIYVAEAFGGRWRIEHSSMSVGPTFAVYEGDSLVGRSHYTREAELLAVFGEGRNYRLRRPSPTLTMWNDGAQDVLSFRANEAFILLGAPLEDAPALLLLGIVMALEHSLYAVGV